MLQIFKMNCYLTVCNNLIKIILGMHKSLYVMDITQIQKFM